jgi:hypothetical protein
MFSIHRLGLGEESRTQLQEEVLHHYGSELAGQSPPQLLLWIDCWSGTGGTRVVELIAAAIDRMADSSYRRQPILRVAATAEMAFHLRGQVAHRLFEIPMARNVCYTSLDAAAARILQRRLRDIRYLIMDGRGMATWEGWDWVDQRCRDIFPSRRGEPFGGVNVVMLIDSQSETCM